MALEFVGDAISLSGLTGSKLKCEVIGEYYPFWWNITSGGKKANYAYKTAIVELDAATGEVYIKDTAEIVLGSAGHSLKLKKENPATENLKLVLVEKDLSCFGHLKGVIRRRWADTDITMAEGPVTSNTSNIYLLNQTLDDALDKMGHIQLGNAIFFFDPLRGAEYATLEKVAKKRLNSFYRTGTEFIVFLFTSDWFLGRDDFAPLPTTSDEIQWSYEQFSSVRDADSLFGNTDWRNEILVPEDNELRQAKLVELYKERLHRWFRYILPLPFNPKLNQTFHLILCSNFATGVRATRDFFCGITGNPKYGPDNRTAFDQFKVAHPEIFLGLSKNQRPLEWRILWKLITEHEEGVCDHLCSDLDPKADAAVKQRALFWLNEQGYLVKWAHENAWKLSLPQYKLNWDNVKAKLTIETPPTLKALSAVQKIEETRLL